jgi:gamma-glutamylcyclotransferase (GGCT)/AIG2-like uncharacterized protein YtfP
MNYYFAYGMNTNLESMSIRCPDSQVVGPAVLADYTLEFSYHCNIRKQENSNVSGLLWTISDQDLRSLDMTEGFPHYYNRITVPVYVNDVVYYSWVYVMNGDADTEPPSTGYWNLVLQGYRQNGLNQQQLYNALIESQGQLINET